MRAVMVVVVIAIVAGFCAGCEKHLKEVRARDTQVVALTPAR